MAAVCRVFDPAERGGCAQASQERTDVAHMKVDEAWKEVNPLNHPLVRAYFDKS